MIEARSLASSVSGAGFACEHNEVLSVVRCDLPKDDVQRLSVWRRNRLEAPNLVELWFDCPSCLGPCRNFDPLPPHRFQTQVPQNLPDFFDQIGNLEIGDRISYNPKTFSGSIM